MKAFQEGLKDALEGVDKKAEDKPFEHGPFGAMKALRKNMIRLKAARKPRRKRA